MRYVSLALLAIFLVGCNSEKGVNRGYVISQSQLEEEVTAAPAAVEVVP